MTVETSCDRPSEGLKADDASRVFVLAGKEVEDNGFQIGGLDVGFPIDPSIPAEVVDHKIDALIVTSRYDAMASNLF